MSKREKEILGKYQVWREYLQETQEKETQESVEISASQYNTCFENSVTCGSCTGCSGCTSCG